MINKFQRIITEFTLEKKSVNDRATIALHKIMDSPALEEVFDLTQIIYYKYDIYFFVNRFDVSDLINSALFKFVKFKLIIEEIKNKQAQEPSLIITPYVLFELIYQIKYLKLNGVYKYIIENYLSVLNNNLLFYDEDLLNFLEIDILSKENEFKRYLDLNNIMFKSRNYRKKKH